jgi:hypothetical protein
MVKNQTVDRRKDKRFQTEKNTYAVLRARGSKLGRVIDISKGGLAFRYVSVGQRLKGPLELDLLSHQYDYRIDKIPVKIITDLELANKKAFKSTTLKRVGVQFGKLTPWTKPHNGKSRLHDRRKCAPIGIRRNN